MTFQDIPGGSDRFGTLQIAGDGVGDGVGLFYGFANVGLVWGRGAVLVVDTSNQRAGTEAVKALREHTREPVELIVYTHGHLDHIAGVGAFLDEARDRGQSPPTIWAHEDLEGRLARYTLTWGWNNEVNRRQFGLPKGVDAFPRSFVPPDRTYRGEQVLTLAGERVELRHARGETDDGTWVWLPERRVALVGDLMVSSMPNTGNPNKTQRFTLGWAEALEAIAACEPQYVLPGHGPLLQGERAIETLRGTARALRYLHDAVLERLNAGLWPDEVVEEDLRLPDELAGAPYLREMYGCVPFVVRDVLRYYAGWWGGSPAELMPTSRAAVAREVVALAGAEPLAARVRALVAEGEPRRALHLAVLLAQAGDGSGSRTLAAEVCDTLAESETSFIARNFYRAAARRYREA